MTEGPAARMYLRILPLIIGTMALLAGCAIERGDRAPDEPKTSERVRRDQPVTKITTAEISPQTMRRLQGRNHQPIRDRELNVRAACTFKDVNGGAGRLNLQVDRADVRQLNAEIEIPGHGICRFDLAGFAQQASFPNVELQSASSTCRVRLWEQNEGVTVAFHECRAHCTGDAVDYLWPILVNPRNGSCA